MAPPSAAHPLGLLDAAQEAPAEVGHPAGVDLAQRRAGGAGIAERASGDRHLHPVVEGHQSEAVLGRQPPEQAVDRLEGRDQ